MRLHIGRIGYALFGAALLAGCADQLPTEVASDALRPGAGAARFVGPFGVVAADDFSGTELDEDLWLLVADPDRASVDDRLSLRVAPNTAEATKLIYRDAQDFEGTGFVVEISQYASGSSSLGTFVAVTDAPELTYVIFNAFNGQLTAWYRWNGAAPVQLPGSLALNSVEHRFLRLREADGIVYYETSANGQTWVQRWSVVHAFPDLSELHGMLGLQAWGTLRPNPTPAIFENVNTTVPAIPRELSGAATAPFTVQLTWQDRSVNETEFQIERRVEGEEEFELLATVPANSTSYDDTGLIDEVTYEYRVRAVGPAGPSSYSQPAAATAEGEPPPPPPAPPAIATVSETFAGTGLDLDKWEVLAAPGRMTIDNRIELVTTPGVNEHSHVRLRQPYSFVGSSFSAEVSRFSGGTTTTETFIGVYSADEEEYVVISVHNNRVTAWYKWRGQAFTQLPGSVTLNAVEHRFLQVREQGGVVYYETSPDGIVWTSHWNLTHALVEPDWMHGYIGVGTWGSLNHNPTPAYFESVNSLVPAAPRGLVATTAPSAITLTWDDRAANESQFEIERSVAGQHMFEPIGTVGANVTTFSDAGLESGSSYDYRVRATSGAGASAFSAVASATAGDEPPPPPPGPPAISTLVDDFSGTELDLDRWELRGPSARLTVNDGATIALSPNSVELVGLMSRDGYDFQGSALVTEITEFASGTATVGTFVAVTNADETSYVIFNVFNGRLTAWRRWNGAAPVQIGSVTLSAANHRFLRLRENAGVVHFETSANGTAWTTRWSVTHAFPDLADLHAYLGVQAWGSSGPAVQPARFAGVNVAP